MRAAVLFVVAVASGCASGPRITPEQASAVRKVALLGVSMDRLGPAPSDAEVQVAATEAARAAFAQRAGERKRFEVVDVRGAPAVLGFSSPTRSSHFASAAASVQGSTDSEKAKAMMAMLGLKKGGGSELEQLERQLDEARAQSVAAEGLAHVPLSALGTPGVSKVEYRNGQRVRTPEEARKEQVAAAAGQLARELGVDALVLLHFRGSLKVGPVNVNDRGLATLKLTAGYLLVNERGEVLVDVAAPGLDDLAPSRLGVPAFRKSDTAREVDLADPAGAVRATLSELAASVSVSVVERLEQLLTPDQKS